MKEKLDLDIFKKSLREYADERDWNQFHTPKNLSMALTVEASELQEIFQWLTSEESAHLDKIKLEKVQDEVADIFVYLIRLCDVLGINLPEAVDEKMKKNSEKYPVDKCKGNAKKYDEL